MGDSRTPRINEIMRLQEDSVDADTIRLGREIALQLGIAFMTTLKLAQNPSHQKDFEKAWTTLADLVMEIVAED